MGIVYGHNFCGRVSISSKFTVVAFERKRQKHAHARSNETVLYTFSIVVQKKRGVGQCKARRNVMNMCVLLC